MPCHDLPGRRLEEELARAHAHVPQDLVPADVVPEAIQNVAFVNRLLRVLDYSFNHYPVQEEH